MSLTAILRYRLSTRPAAQNSIGKPCGHAPAFALTAMSLPPLNGRHEVQF